MRRVVVPLAAAIALLAAAFTAPPAGALPSGPWLKPGVPYSHEHPDPSLVSMGPLVYSYATNHGGSDLPVTWSADAVTWTARSNEPGTAGRQDGDVGFFNDSFPSVPWGIDYNSCNASTSGCDPKELWAPSVAHVGRRWVAFHAVKVAREPAYSPYGRFAIYASVADSPFGPFRAASSSPIVSTSTSSDPAGAIDPDVYVEQTTGRAYLIWKTEGNRSGNYPAIWSRQLDGSGTAFAPGSVARKLITVSQSWEGRVVENPSLTKVSGRYVLLYSGNEFSSTSYATGYALCSSPTGPCSKSGSNPILRSTAGAYGTGGADGLVDQRGRFIAAYHAWTGASGGRGTGIRTQHVMELTTDLSQGVRVLQRDLRAGRGPDSVWSHDPSGAYTGTPATVNGDFAPTTGDFTGDGRSDILWYGAWTRADALWAGTATKGTFSSRTLDQRGTFLPLSGDFDGNGRTDVFWYQPGSDPLVADPTRSGSNHEPNARNDQLWLSSTAGWVVRDLSMPLVATPVVGDFDGDGDSDIIWVQPGNGADEMWMFSGGVPTRRSISILGNYQPVVGDFDGDGVDDVFWYGPGAASDSIWWFDRDGGHVGSSSRVSGELYRPFTGRFDADEGDDIMWYTPGPGTDVRWSHITRAGGFRDTRRVINGTYQPLVGDYDGNGVEDIFWYS